MENFNVNDNTGYQGILKQYRTILIFLIPHSPTSSYLSYYEFAHEAQLMINASCIVHAKYCMLECIPNGNIMHTIKLQSALSLPSYS